MFSLSGWAIHPLVASAQGAVNLYGTVYDDRNRNGVFDAGDVGMAGVTVNLFDTVSGSVVLSVTSAPDGSYNFSVDEPFIGFNRSHSYAIFVSSAGGVTVPTSPPMTTMLGSPAAVWNVTNLALDGSCCTTSPAQPYNFGFAAAGYGIANPYTTPYYGQPATTYQPITTYAAPPVYVDPNAVSAAPAPTNPNAVRVISDGIVESGGMLYINLNAGENNNNSTQTNPNASNPAYQPFPYNYVSDPSQIPQQGDNIVITPAPSQSMGGCSPYQMAVTRGVILRC